MKSRLLAIAALLVLAPPVFAAGIGRYQVVTGSAHTVLIDTRTGKTWVLAPVEYKAGAPQEQRYEWSPIGFMHGRALTPPHRNDATSPKGGAGRAKN